MKKNTTIIWFLLALVLAAAVGLVEKFLKPSPPPDHALLAGLRASAVTSVQVTPAGEREISVNRTNNSWFLDRPVAYPAQATAIENLLSVLEKLSPTLRLTAAETQSHKNVDAEFGFENPQFRITITAGEHSWPLLIGNATAPGDGVYVRLVGGAGVFVTDIGWLQALPRDVSAWRDTSLVADVGTIDWIVITNGVKAIELRRDPTNRLWRMIRPLQTRADGNFITTALQQLRSASATRFVTDDPKADLSAYGLQPVDLDVWLGHGTNLLEGIHAGKDSAESAGQLYAQRDGWNSVITVPQKAIVPWRGDVNDFRDPHLLAFPAPTAQIAEIELRGQNSFTLRQQGSNQWMVAGEKFPVDMANLQLLVKLLANLRIAEFVKDAATATDLEKFGLAPTNSGSITLRSAAADTNAVLAQIIFGATETNKIYVKRGDESFLYALPAAEVSQLPMNGWQLRDRRIWNFSGTNVAQITLQHFGKTFQINHTGFNQWSPAPGSQGLVDPVGLEETANQLGSLTTAMWIDRNFSLAPPEKYGMSTNNLQISIELKTGEKLAVDFGMKIPSTTEPTALASVTLEGDRWLFVFPPIIYQLVDTYLTIPAGTP